MIDSQSYADAFEDIAHSLTEENWGKHSLFELNNGQICMCAHGKVQARFNPKVKEILQSMLVRRKVECAFIYATPYSDTAASGEAYAQEHPSCSLEEFWNKRPVRDHEVDGHYLLGMVGLTPSFNDDSSTTLEMVRDKFREAAALARQLNV